MKVLKKSFAVFALVLLSFGSLLQGMLPGKGQRRPHVAPAQLSPAQQKMCVRCQAKPVHPGSQYCSIGCRDNVANILMCDECNSRPANSGYIYCSRSCGRAAQAKIKNRCVTCYEARVPGKKHCKDCQKLPKCPNCQLKLQGGYQSGCCSIECDVALRGQVPAALPQPVVLMQAPAPVQQAQQWCVRCNAKPVHPGSQYCSRGCRDNVGPQQVPPAALPQPALQAPIAQPQPLPVPQVQPMCLGCNRNPAHQGYQHCSQKCADGLPQPRPVMQSPAMLTCDLCNAPVSRLQGGFAKGCYCSDVCKQKAKGFIQAFSSQLKFLPTNQSEYSYYMSVKGSSNQHPMDELVNSIMAMHNECLGIKNGAMNTIVDSPSELIYLRVVAPCLQRALQSIGANPGSKVYEALKMVIEQPIKSYINPLLKRDLGEFCKAVNVTIAMQLKSLI